MFGIHYLFSYEKYGMKSVNSLLSKVIQGFHEITGHYIQWFHELPEYFREFMKPLTKRKCLVISRNPWFHNLTVTYIHSLLRTTCILNHLESWMSGILI